MKRLGWIATGLVVVCMAGWVGCKKGGPCSGGGKVVDERPLPEQWAEMAPAPEGAAACRFEDGGTDSEDSRYYELGESPEEGFQLWRDHLTSLGWAEGEDTSSERGFGLTFTREGASLTLYVSRSVEDTGWSTIAFTGGITGN